MRRALFDRRRDRLTGILLGALLLRAYVPVGFMPAGGTPFLLAICPAELAFPPAVETPVSRDPASATDMSPDMTMAPGVVMSMPMRHGHHRHSDSHAHFANCPFGSASTAGPLPQFTLFDRPARPSASAGLRREAARFATQLPAAHRARGPPHPG